MNKFRYIPYWGTWRRWIGEWAGLTYEVELTPINPTSDFFWDNMGIRIFACDLKGSNVKKDCVNLLPAHVFQLMVDKLGGQRANALVAEDFFANIDFDKFKLHNNGGADFFKIKKD